MGESTEFETFRGLVYPAQCDAMGHMDVQYYVAAFDTAMWHLVHRLGHRRRDDALTGHGWADLRHVIDYRSELPAGALYRVVSDILRIGLSSLITRHRMCAL